MNTLLVVEASTAVGSVALLRDGRILDERQAAMGVSRDDALLPAIAEILQVAGIAPSALAGIVCGSGPGSFTSLRIAASLCKGLASAHQISLYGVSSLLLAAGELVPQMGEYLVHSDALRGERFVLAADVRGDGRVVAAGNVTRVPFARLDEMATAMSRRLVSVGVPDTALDARQLVTPHAHGVALLGLPLSAFGPVSLSEWEPDYGRLAEAQVKWELDHGRTLPAI